jgi:hypothetical protein
MTTALALAAALTTTTPAQAAADPCARYIDVAHKVGWPRSQDTQLRHIMQRESHCLPQNINWADPHGGSWGLLQINGSHRGWLTRGRVIRDLPDLLNPATNLRAGLQLWRLYGWRPWGTRSSIPQP